MHNDQGDRSITADNLFIQRGMHISCVCGLHLQVVCRIAGQPRLDYKEDVCEEDRQILSRLTASGFVMTSSKTPAKAVSDDSSLMQEAE